MAEELNRLSIQEWKQNSPSQTLQQGLRAVATNASQLSLTPKQSSPFPNTGDGFSALNSQPVLPSLSVAEEEIDSIINEDVDVIGKAKTIRRLLACSIRSDQEASFTVHRIGKTMLIDEFETQMPFGSAPAPVCVLDAFDSRSKSQIIRCLSPDATPANSDSDDDDDDEPSTLRWGPDSIALKPIFEAANKRVMQQNYKWDFRDLRMLVSSNMAIFGDSNHPAVSVHVRQEGNPINVLTGLDYWLDNLMCNVPEIVMCYHLDGVVKRFELMKTEDIPTAAGFNQESVHDLARNILSFLRSNCTQEGHTYWLYKAPTEDIVRLYDLTVLCENAQEASGTAPKNPFAQPVAMLLLKIAMKMMVEPSRNRESLTIKTLLMNVLKLVTAKECPQIYAMASFFYSQLNPTGTAPPSRGKHTDGFVAEVQREDFLRPTAPPTPPPTPLPATMTQHYTMALEYLATSLRELLTTDRRMTDSISGDNTWRGGLIRAVINRAAVNYAQLGNACIMDAVSTPACLRHCRCALHILSLQDLRPAPTSTSSAASALTSTPTFTPTSTPSFTSTSTSAPTSAAASESTIAVFGTNLAFSPDMPVVGMVLEVISDVLSLLHTIPNITAPSLNADFADLPPDDLLFISTANGLYHNMGHDPFDISQVEADGKVLPWYSWSKLQLCTMFEVNSLENIAKATELYETLLRLKLQFNLQNVDLRRIQRKLGNNLNILGSHYLKLAESTDPSGGEELLQQHKDFWRQAHEYLRNGVLQFESSGDVVNASLMSCNLAKLMRVGYVATLLNPNETAKVEFHRLHKTAIDLYEKVLVALKRRDQAPVVYDMAITEIAGAHLAFATLVQDTLISSKAELVEDAERKVTDSLMTALHYYEQLRKIVAANQLDQVIYRLSCVHQRLGKQQLVALRTGRIKPDNRKHAYKLAAQHFEKALNTMSGLHVAYPRTVIAITQDILLLQAPLDGSQSSTKQLEEALLFLTRGTAPIQSLLAEASDEAFVVQSLGTFENHLLFILRELTRLSLQSSSAVGRKRSLGLKAMTESTMAKLTVSHAPLADGSRPSIRSQCTCLAEVLTWVRSQYEAL